MTAHVERYVYSATCTWHGPISEVTLVSTAAVINGTPVQISLPGCPHCRSPLMEYRNRAKWDEQADNFVAKNPDVPLYREWLESLRGVPCRPLKDWDWRAAYRQFERTKTS
jgi:hypothetical protein